MVKRKLDANDKPAAAPQAASPDPESSKSAPPGEDSKTTTPGFSELGLDARLLQAIASQKYQTPTLVQSKVVPLALNGQDVLAKAKTGSGKTAAYLLPLLHAILKRKQVCFVSSSFLCPYDDANKTSGWSRRRSELICSRLIVPHLPPPSFWFRLENSPTRSFETSSSSQRSVPKTSRPSN